LRGLAVCLLKYLSTYLDLFVCGVCGVWLVIGSAGCLLGCALPWDSLCGIEQLIEHTSAGLSVVVCRRGQTVAQL
jgi:hypothetical protein